ncbi:MAG: NAD(P)/FAD-dependent oxidoreductase [Acidobacteria bacterium]|nr:NAD(P)/FAD-dependent oxidoreductase [Acidobacteriota bacterium]
MKGAFKPVPYRRISLEHPYDAIVIGSGAGGLTAAVLLALHGGKRVLVLERHYTAGGFTHVFKRPGFEWDVGVHYIGQVGDPQSEVRRIFDHITEGRLQWSGMPYIYDRVFLGNQVFDFPSGVEHFRERMKAYFPRDRHAIDEYIATVNRCVQRMGLFFAEKSMPPLLSRTLGSALRLPFLRYSDRTTAETLRDITNNPELAGVLTAQWGDYGLPPSQSSFAIHATVASHYFDGGSYPIGGAASFMSSMLPAIERAGGNVLVNADVDSILVESGRAAGVRMADGVEIRAPIVISDAGAANTYNRLLSVKTSALDAIRADMKRIPPAISHLCLYAGLEGTASQLGLNGTNLWIHASADHDANVRRFVSDPESEFPVVFISFPSAKDPTFDFRFPSHSTVEVITLAPYEWFDRWEHTRWRKREDDYEALKQRLQSRLLDVLYNHVPAARGHVIHTELSTPLTTRHFTNHAHGEIYGLGHTPERFRLRALGPRTPVRNLYLTGQDAAVCGVTGAVAGGILAVSAVLRRNMFAVVTKKTSAPASRRAAA